MPLKFIVIYAAYGDALLLQTPDLPPRYWLIDGGPITPRPTDTIIYNKVPLNAYYQYLKRALYRYCSSKNDGVIDNLSGIIVTHPDSDHMAGINRLLRTDLAIPTNFKGPVLLNSTFYRTETGQPFDPSDPSNPFKYPLVQFLNDNKFGLSKVDPSSPQSDIPTNMNNASLADVYKMVYNGHRDPYPQPGEYKWQKHDLDSSPQNWSSIITIWHEQGDAKFSLVTTGDGLPSYIIDRMNVLATPPRHPIPSMGIFKVPHHGSEYNNQWDDNENYADSDTEKKIFFCLTMLALYSDQRNSASANMTRFLRGILDGTPMLDWTCENKALPAVFEASIRQLSGSFCTYLELYVKSASIKKENEKARSFDLKTDQGRLDFSNNLLDRYDDRKSQIIKNGRIEKGSTGDSKVSVSFGGFKGYFENAIKLDSTAEPKYFETMFKCLDRNGLDDLRKARLVQNFYSKFNADNYVISANRYPHGHPKSSVIAGLMAHLILDDTVTYCRRIFLTDGASVIVDYVYDLLTDLLPPSKPPGTWSQKVGVYYLATDFLAEIPVDLSHVGGVERIDFSTYATPNNENYFTFLHNQFMEAKPYDMPRAAISQTSTFHIKIWSNQDPDEKYLDMNANGLTLAAQGDRPLFHLLYIDHSAVNVSNWVYKEEPHFRLFTGQTTPINDLVFFVKSSRTSLDRSESLVYKDSGIGQVESLRLNNGAISFRSVNVAPARTLATVEFERNPGV